MVLGACKCEIHRGDFALRYTKCPDWKGGKRMPERDSVREQVAKLLNWYNDGYRDWNTMLEEEREVWRARAEDILAIPELAVVDIKRLEE